MRTAMFNVHLFAFILGSSAAIAQESGMSHVDPGELEYRNSCVSCHGTSGEGDGPVTEFLSGAKPADLTVLQKNNGGVFPVAKVYAMIEGSDAASAHGTRDMPIWGDRFSTRAREELLDPRFPDVARRYAKEYARNRVLALVDYLARIQRK